MNGRISPAVRLKRYGTGLALLCSVLAFSAPSPAHAATGVIRGRVTVNGQPVPAGSVQVAFVKYIKHATYLCTAGQPTTNALLATTVNGDGRYSMSLDTAYNWKIIFKPMTTAPRTAVFRWYTASTTAGTTVGYSSSPGATQATCITNLTAGGLSDINLDTNGASIQATGTITLADGTPTSAAAIAFVPSAACYFNKPEGYIARPNDQGYWEIAGIDTNQSNHYLQVVSPAGAVGGVCNPVYYGKKTGSTVTLIPAADVATCGASCLFSWTTSDFAKINLRLPVTGVVTGTVSGPAGPVGAGEVCVRAFRDGGNAMNFWSVLAGSACTDASGVYTLNVVYDNYRLLFERQAGTSYISEWNLDVPTSSGYTAANIVCVKTSGDGCAGTKTVNATLALGHTISGRITDSNNRAVASATVQAMSWISSCMCYASVANVMTDSNGLYSLTGLLSGTYALMASHPDYGQVWLGGTRETATQFSVSGNTGGKNFSFPRGYVASGSISIGEGTEARICVSAYLLTSNEMGWGDFANGNCFSAPGKWELKGLKEGRYRFRFDAQTGNLRSTFLGGTDINQATVITITNTDVTGLDVLVAAGKTITGKISNGDVGVANVCVTAFKSSETDYGWGTWAGGSCTGTTGEYSIRGLEAGIYRLRVEPPSSSDYTPGFYSTDGTPVRNYSDGSIVTIAAGSNSVTATTQALQKSPMFTGVVVDNGTLTSGICVNAIRKTNEYSWGEFGVSSCSGIDGKISLKGLTAGQYRFQVNPYSGSYQSGWYRASNTTTTDLSLATLVTLADADVSLGNIALAAGKKASGIITDGEKPIMGACIGALKDDGTQWGAWTSSSCTNANGEFVLRGLDPASSYWFRVDVWVGDFKPGFVTATRGIASTTTDIASRPATSDIDLGTIVLPTAPSIKGNVTSGGGSTKEPNVCVSAHDSSTLQWVTTSCSSFTGAYSLRGLTGGNSYKLYWWTQNKNLTNGWYKQSDSGFTQVQTPDDATSLTVPTNGLTDVNLRLANGAVISGSLSTGLCVAAWVLPGTNAANRTDAVAVTCASETGKYELKGLTAGIDYFLQVFRTDGQSVTQSSPGVNDAVRTGGTVDITAS